MVVLQKPMPSGTGETDSGLRTLSALENGIFKKKMEMEK